VQAPEPARAVGHPPTGGTGIRPAGPETHPETPPGGRAAVKAPASAPSAPVYHYSFRTKAGVIGRDFARPLTPDEQSAIARQLENGQPGGTHGATVDYDSENGVYHYNFPTKSGLSGLDFTRPLTPQERSAIARQIASGQPVGAQAPPGVAPAQAKVNPSGPQQHFNLPSKPDPAIVGVKFQGTGHIPQSETWNDPKYAAFRNYHHEWHNGEWWRHHCSRIVLIAGGWYYSRSGYWYPAWGYDSLNSYYPYDGPIYAYNGLEPDEVIANVQAALQSLGYYHGPITGLLDYATRVAIANYQQDHGLYATSAIDEPTLASIGMA